MEIIKLVKKSFDVRGVQVTEENLEEVSEWCGGEVKTDSFGTKYIKVNVKRPLNEKQTRAYLTDWVLRSQQGFKVYNDKALQKSFEVYDDLSTAVRQNLVYNAVVINPTSSDHVSSIPPKSDFKKS